MLGDWIFQLRWKRGIGRPPQAAKRGGREASWPNSRMRCRTYPSSVRCAEAVLRRLAPTIWSSGWRWGNCGSNSLQNSQGLQDRTSNRFLVICSMCSMYLLLRALWGLGSESVRYKPKLAVLPDQHLPAASFYYSDAFFTSLATGTFSTAPGRSKHRQPTAEH
jgi:hypothetical protein